MLPSVGELKMQIVRDIVHKTGSIEKSSMYHQGLLALQQTVYSTLYRVCWLLVFVHWAVWV